MAARLRKRRQVAGCPISLLPGRMRRRSRRSGRRLRQTRWKRWPSSGAPFTARCRRVCNSPGEDPPPRGEIRAGEDRSVRPRALRLRNRRSPEATRTQSINAPSLLVVEGRKRLSEHRLGQSTRKENVWPGAHLVISGRPANHFPQQLLDRRDP